ncbi:MAG: DUF1292 domain-containing protein [Lachnospiraceae bacterium]|nr:DUF1292 domain-containing protein [Lachnospiraceae bacterium]
MNTFDKDDELFSQNDENNIEIPEDEFSILDDFDDEEYDYYEPDGDYIIDLEDEEGTTIPCQVCFYFTLRGHDIVALSPQDGEYDDSIIPYFYTEYENGNFDIDPIDDEELYEEALDRIDEILDDNDFDELPE